MRINDGFLDGVVYAAQEVVIGLDEPTIAKGFVLASGYELSDFLTAQKRTGFHSRQMNRFFREIFKEDKP